MDPVTFARDFEEEDDLRLAFDYSRLRRPSVDIRSGGDLFLDAREYAFDELGRTTVSDSRDRDWAVKGDAGYAIPFATGTLTAQGGFKARWRTKRHDAEIDIFDGFDGDLTLARFPGRQSYGLANVEPKVDPAAWRRFVAATGYGPFDRDDVASGFDSAVEDYSASEDVLAGSLLGRYQTRDLCVIGGVRVERIRTTAAGNAVTLTEAEDDELVTVTPVAFAKRYTDWLPSISVRYGARQIWCCASVPTGAWSGPTSPSSPPASRSRRMTTATARVSSAIPNSIPTAPGTST